MSASTLARRLHSILQNPLSPLVRALLLILSVVGASNDSIAQGSDDCAAPQDLGSAFGVFPVDTMAATTGTHGQTIDPQALIDCSLVFGGVPGVENDVWFTWTAPSGLGGVSTGIFTLCNQVGPANTRLQIWRNLTSCPTAGPNGWCGDNECGLASRGSIFIAPGAVYLIQVGSAPGTAPFTGTLTITRPPPANDSCASPTVVGGSGSLSVDLAGATYDPGQGPSSNCGPMGVDIWYKYLCPNTIGQVTFETCGSNGLDTRIGVYRDTGSGCPTLEGRGCADGGCGPEARISFIHAAGQIYYIQVGTAPGVFGGPCTLTYTAGPPQIRISQIYAGNGQPGAYVNGSFVELYNASDCGLSLTELSLQWQSDTQTGAWNVLNFSLGGLNMLGRGYRLIGGGGSTSDALGQIPSAAEDTFFGVGLGAAGKVALVKGLVPLVDNPGANPNVIDLVGWGSNANVREPLVGGTPNNNAAWGGTNDALHRLGCGEQDTNDNAADFRVGIPWPRRRWDLDVNRGVFALGSLSPHLARPGETIRILAQPMDCGSGRPLTEVTSVEYWSSVTNTWESMFDDGTHGDEAAGDGYYSSSYTAVPSNEGSVGFKLRVNGVEAPGRMALLGDLGAPPNDNCSTALLLPSVYPTSTSSSFTEARAEYNPTLAGGAVPAGFVEQGLRRGVWYRVVGNGRLLTADTCSSPLIGGATIPDTVIQVFCGTCDGLLWLAGNDDNPTLCGLGAGVERRSRVTWCTAAGQEYFVWVGPKATGAQTAAFTLTISQGAVCSGATPCLNCPPSRPLGSLDENEGGFGPHTNDGCWRAPFTFGEVMPGAPAQVVYGSVRGYGHNRDGDWYRFQAPRSETLTVTLNSQFNGSAVVYRLSPTGDCSAVTFLGETWPNDRCIPDAFSVPVVAGEWYAVLVLPLNWGGGTILGGVAPGATSFHYTLALELPDIDVCTGAITLAVPSTRTGSTAAASLDAGLPASCDGPGVGDTTGPVTVTAPGVWYRVVSATNRTLYADALTANFNAQLSIFSGPCGSLSCVTANDAVESVNFRPKVAWRAQAGVEYFVLVHGWQGAVGDFTLNVTGSTFQPNDDCAAATVLSGASGSRNGTLVGATGELTNVNSSQFASCAPPHTLWDVWYSWTSPCTGTATFATCGTWNTLLSVHSACPTTGNANELGGATCNDNGPVGCAPGAQLSFPAAQGTTYLVRVATAGPQTTSAGGGQPFTLTWSMPGLLDSDGDSAPDCIDGCPSNPALTSPALFYPDLDGDGFGAGTGVLSCGGAGTVGNNQDCNDGNSAIRPGATEVCNGVDEDCDTLIDEGVTTTYYRDADGDGFGSPSDTVQACSQPSGFVTVAGDCNDANPGIRPGATEVCNGVDDDCDTQIDEGVATTYYRDLDGDGFGNPASTTQACTQPSGYVTNNGDCNDNNASIHPGAIEVCDGVDNNCVAGIDEGFDIDSDGVRDCDDNCPNASNPTQADSDADGLGNACDNCPVTFNPGQADCDNDGVGNACETDPDCNGNLQPDPCDILAGSSFDVNANLIPDECEGIVGFCFGDGTGLPCRCGNNGAPGHGCANSANAVGAHLTAVGIRQVSLDTLVLDCTNMTGATCVFFQGASTIPPILVDDGIGCVGGPVIRLGTKLIGGGNSSFPQPGDPLISVRGQIPPSGATRFYQCFYRNASALFCPPATSNRSNGVAVTWIP